LEDLGIDERINIRMYLIETVGICGWMHLVHYMDQWWSFVNRYLGWVIS